MSKEEKDGAAGWFLGQLVRSPATWIGLAAGTAMGFAFSQVGPIGGAIGLGRLVALAAGGFSFLVNYGIRSSHRIAQDQKEIAGNTAKLEKENAVSTQLTGAGLVDEAGILEKLRKDRDAIQARRAEISDNALAGHMALVATTIVDTACARLEEFADLVRRVEDPILESPDDSEARIAEIRNNLSRAYRAVADARSRLRQIESQHEPEIFDDPSDVDGLDLGALASKLEAENELSRRVEKRLETDYRSTIVHDDPEPESEERIWEFE